MTTDRVRARAFARRGPDITRARTGPGDGRRPARASRRIPRNHGGIADPAVLDRVRAAHAAHTSDVLPEAPRPGAIDLAAEWPGTDLATLAEFGDRTERIYRRRLTWSRADYLAYLSTVSAYRILPGRTRDAVFAAVAESLADQVDLDVHTMLYLARRLPD